ncbi:MAG: trypsin-like serine peptidase, partial [Solirubrobacterales bacterium]
RRRDRPRARHHYPQRVHGLLLVEIAGQGASCSATVVSSREEDVIVTAGHCLLVPGEVSGGAGIVFAESVAFIPGYRNPGTGATPAEPFGRFAGVRLGTPRAFAQTGDISFDFGVVKLAPGAAGKIETAIGSRGIAFNRKSKSFRGDVFEINGYPARPPPEYDPTRRRMILCVSSFQGFERSTGAPVVGPCNQQEGSSGAGWVRKRRVESLTSHAGCASPAGCSLISGSYFGDEEFNVYRELGGVATGKRKKLKRCKKKPSKSKRTGCRRKLQRFSPTGA